MTPLPKLIGPAPLAQVLRTPAIPKLLGGAACPMQTHKSPTDSPCGFCFRKRLTSPAAQQDVRLEWLQAWRRNIVKSQGPETREQWSEDQLRVKGVDVPFRKARISPALPCDQLWDVYLELAKRIRRPNSLECVCLCHAHVTCQYRYCKLM